MVLVKQEHKGNPAENGRADAEEVNDVSFFQI